MGHKTEDLAPITSEAELSPGVTVVVKPCLLCGKTDFDVLKRIIPNTCDDPNCSSKHYSRWMVVGGCFNGKCYTRAIAEGRLFKIKGVDARPITVPWTKTISSDASGRITIVGSAETTKKAGR